MKIKKFNESNIEEEFVTNQEIEEFFYEWTDEEEGKLEIKEILIVEDKFNKSGRVIPYTTYIKNPSKTKKGKLVTLTIKKPNGVNLSSVSSMSNSFTDFKTLEKALNDIKRFYIHTGEKEINYQINNSYRGLELLFIVSGPIMLKTETKVEDIDSLLGELKDIFSTHFRNIDLRGNWLEIRIPKRRESEDPRWWSIFRNDDYIPQPNNIIEQKISNWKNKVREKGFDLDISGGDLQAVFKLKKL